MCDAVKMLALDDNDDVLMSLRVTLPHELYCHYWSGFGTQEVGTGNYLSVVNRKQNYQPGKTLISTEIHQQWMLTIISLISIRLCISIEAIDSLVSCGWQNSNIYILNVNYWYKICIKSARSCFMFYTTVCFIVIQIHNPEQEQSKQDFHLTFPVVVKIHILGDQQDEKILCFVHFYGL